jgi:hypothetical protein
MTEGLTDTYHNNIINLVESQSAQDANEFAEVLMRSTFTDGQNMLVGLHSSGKLIKVGTSEVEMIPTTNSSIVLSELNQIIAEQRGISVDDLALKPVNAPSTAKAEAKVEATPTATVLESTDVADPGPDASPDTTAKFYRSQADKLAKEAAKFRRLAEELVPTKKVK